MQLEIRSLKKNSGFNVEAWIFFQASLYFQWHKVENSLLWSLLTFIYIRSSYMNHFMYFTSVISSLPTACWKGAGRVKAKMTQLGLHSTRLFSSFHWSTSHNMPQIFPLSTKECPFRFQTPSDSYNNSCYTSNKYILFFKSTNCTFLRFPPFFQSAVYTLLRMAFTDCV